MPTKLEDLWHYATRDDMTAARLSASMELILTDLDRTRPGGGAIQHVPVSVSPNRKRSEMEVEFRSGKAFRIVIEELTEGIGACT